MTIFIGIDIGLSGAICRIGGNIAPVIADLTAVNDGPLRTLGNGSTTQPKRLCGRALAQQLREMCPPNEVAIVAFEDVRPRPEGNGGRHGNTMHSQGSLMRSRGIVESAVDIARFEAVAVRPQAWKKMFGLHGADKSDSLQLAKSLYPSLAGQLRLVKHHNRAESLLIAHWALKSLA